jgi:uncharacterized RDD family membrane protein YckC
VVQGPPISEGAPLAGFGRRALALLIDAAILFVAFVLFGVLLFAFGLSDTAAVGLLYLLAIVYYPLGWSRISEGQTFGMRALDIEVVGRDGTFISPWRAIGRYLAANISAIPLGLGFWWAIWDQENQTWHDKLAGTWVRRVDYAPRAAATSTPPALATRHPCPRCGESIAMSARACRYCGLALE